MSSQNLIVKNTSTSIKNVPSVVNSGLNTTRQSVSEKIGTKIIFNNKNTPVKKPLPSQPISEKIGTKIIFKTNNKGRFQCPQCPKTYKFNGKAIQKHILTHGQQIIGKEGSKIIFKTNLFKCQLCPKTYKSKGWLTRHMRSNHSDNKIEENKPKRKISKKIKISKELQKEIKEMKGRQEKSVSLPKPKGNMVGKDKKLVKKTKKIRKKVKILVNLANTYREEHGHEAKNSDVFNKIYRKEFNPSDLSRPPTMKHRTIYGKWLEKIEAPIPKPIEDVEKILIKIKTKPTNKRSTIIRKTKPTNKKDRAANTLAAMRKTRTRKVHKQPIARPQPKFMKFIKKQKPQKPVVVKRKKVHIKNGKLSRKKQKRLRKIMKKTAQWLEDNPTAVTTRKKLFRKMYQAVRPTKTTRKLHKKHKTMYKKWAANLYTAPVPVKPIEPVAILIGQGKKTTVVTKIVENTLDELSSDDEDEEEDKDDEDDEEKKEEPLELARPTKHQAPRRPRKNRRKQRQQQQQPSTPTRPPMPNNLSTSPMPEDKPEQEKSIEELIIDQPAVIRNLIVNFRQRELYAVEGWYGDETKNRGCCMVKINGLWLYLSDYTGDKDKSICTPSQGQLDFYSWEDGEEKITWEDYDSDSLWTTCYYRFYKNGKLCYETESSGNGIPKEDFDLIYNPTTEEDLNTNMSWKEDTMFENDEDYYQEVLRIIGNKYGCQELKDLVTGKEHYNNSFFGYFKAEVIAKNNKLKEKIIKSGWIPGPSDHWLYSGRNDGFNDIRLEYYLNRVEIKIEGEEKEIEIKGGSMPEQERPDFSNFNCDMPSWMRQEQQLEEIEQQVGDSPVSPMTYTQKEKVLIDLSIPSHKIIPEDTIGGPIDESDFDSDSDDESEEDNIFNFDDLENELIKDVIEEYIDDDSDSDDDFFDDLEDEDEDDTPIWDEVETIKD